MSDRVEQVRTAHDLAALQRQVKDALYGFGHQPIRATAIEWLTQHAQSLREAQVLLTVYQWTFAANGDAWQPLGGVAFMQLGKAIGLSIRSVHTTLRVDEVLDALISRGDLHRIRSLGGAASIFWLGAVNDLLAGALGSQATADPVAAAAALQMLAEREAEAEARYQATKRSANPLLIDVGGSAPNPLLIDVGGSAAAVENPLNATDKPPTADLRQTPYSGGAETPYRNPPPLNNPPTSHIANGITSQPADAGALVDKPAERRELARLNGALPEAQRWQWSRLLSSHQTVGFEATRAELLHG